MKIIKILRNESMLTKEGKIDFKVGQVVEAADWIAASLLGRGYAEETDEKAKIKVGADPAPAPIEILKNEGAENAPNFTADNPGDVSPAAEDPKKKKK